MLYIWGKIKLLPQWCHMASLNLANPGSVTIQDSNKWIGFANITFKIIATSARGQWFNPHSILKLYMDGLVQDCSNSSALAMELLQSCTKPLILCWPIYYANSSSDNIITKFFYPMQYFNLIPKLWNKLHHSSYISWKMPFFSENDSYYIFFNWMIFLFVLEIIYEHTNRFWKKMILP